jgi:excisionase family DNA binding protein
VSLDENLRELVREVVREELAVERRKTPWGWLTTKQAGELLGISSHRVAARVREGKLPGRTYGGRVYVDRQELERVFARRSGR